MRGFLFAILVYAAGGFTVVLSGAFLIHALIVMEHGQVYSTRARALPGLGVR